MAQTVSVPAVEVEDRDDDRLLLTHDPRLDDVFAQGLDDRQFDVLERVLHLSSGSARLAGMDDLLRQAHGLGLDDSVLADMLLGEDVRQEDRQDDRALEVGDDRLAPQVEQQGEPGDMRQEDRQDDRALEPGDVRQEDRQDDRALEVGDDRLTRQAEPQVEHDSGSSDSGKSVSVSGEASKTSSGSSSRAAVSTASATSPTSATSATSSTSATSKSSASGSGSGGHGGGHDDAGGHH